MCCKLLAVVSVTSLFMPLEVLAQPQETGASSSSLLTNVFWSVLPIVLVGNAVAVKLSRFHCARALASRLAGLGLLGFGLKLAIKRQ